MGPLRERYQDLIAHPQRIEEVLQEGARKARAVAAPFLRELLEAVGLRRMVAPGASTREAVAGRAAVPVFKQYRESDGRFFFKLSAADGRVLLQSDAFATGRDAGLWIARLKSEPRLGLAGAPVARTSEVSEQDVLDALNHWAA